MKIKQVLFNGPPRTALTLLTINGILFLIHPPDWPFKVWLLISFIGLAPCLMFIQDDGIARTYRRGKEISPPNLFPALSRFDGLGGHVICLFLIVVLLFWVMFYVPEITGAHPNLVIGTIFFTPIFFMIYK